MSWVRQNKLVENDKVANLLTRKKNIFYASILLRFSVYVYRCVNTHLSHHSKNSFHILPMGGQKRVSVGQYIYLSTHILFKWVNGYTGRITSTTQLMYRPVETAEVSYLLPCRFGFICLWPCVLSTVVLCWQWHRRITIINIILNQ